LYRYTKVVKVRAESMAAAAKVGNHGMLSVVGLADDALAECCAEAKAKLGGDDCVCVVANYLFPQGRVVSGDKNALEEVTKLATAKAGSSLYTGVSDWFYRPGPTGGCPQMDGVLTAKLREKCRPYSQGALKCTPVAVSGAFHTSRMSSARDALVEVLKTVTFSKPKTPVYSNVTGKVIDDHTKIPEMLAEQLVSPVLWEDTMKNLITEVGLCTLNSFDP
jgi:[acyl-carrier-protein] S-malonyltransferase